MVGRYTWRRRPRATTPCRRAARRRRGIGTDRPTGLRRRDIGTDRRTGPRRRRAAGRRRLTARRAADTGADLWSTFNRVQENTIRGGLQAWGRDGNNRPRRITSREVTGIDQDVKLNRALWMLGERMAALKSAA